VVVDALTITIIMEVATMAVDIEVVEAEDHLVLELNRKFILNLNQRVHPPVHQMLLQEITKFLGEDLF
jgi:hypothetical protein